MRLTLQKLTALWFPLVWVGGLTVVPAASAQGSLADYERAQALQAKARDLVVNAPGAITWIGEPITFGTRGR